jgi:histidinol dehydrogenase
MDILINPPKSQWDALCQRPLQDDPVVRSRVESILSRVRNEGDAALEALSREIDGRAVALEVTPEQLRASAGLVRPAVREAISQAAANIRAFHQTQLPREIRVETQPGVLCIQRPVPIRRIGLYIPGGTAPLFSTVLMLAIPATLAGCREVILCSPAGASGEIAPEVLYAAWYCGIRRVFRVGGAQAIAAMAYGTETLPRVDKIFGPGNRYVTTAKQVLGGKSVTIDMPAGPSEVMVIADEDANPAFVAADLLSQAEHGPDSQVMLACLSEGFARRVMAEVERQVALLPRGQFATEALSHSCAVVLDTLDAAVELAETYAPEHLILALADPRPVADRITAAGSVFLGPWSPESAGDYASGTNHTLPTSGWARACSGVSVESFLRRMSLQEISQEGLQRLAPTIREMAEAEGLDAHARAVEIRVEAAPAPAETADTRQRLRTLMRSNIRTLAPYSTARDDCSGTPEVFLDANESPYPTGWNRYPDPRQRQLKQAVSALKRMPVENIFLGNGSDEAIDLMYRVFCEPGRDRAIIVSPSYGMYSVAAQTNDVAVIAVPLNEDYSLPADAIAAATAPDTKLLFICSPNNPTGNAFPLEELAAVIRTFPGITVLDEAYADFSAKGSLLPRLAEFPRLVILQTLSKAGGMAGLRIGMAFADPLIIRILDQVKYPYNINQPAQELALAALREGYAGHVAEICEQRELLARRLAAFSFVRKVHPSDANFLLVQVDDPQRVYAKLLADGIIVRDRSRVAQCEGALRITVGTPEENRRLLASLTAYETLKPCKTA